VKKNNRGFTLIELIVVITILGVAAGLVGLTVGTAVSARAQGTATSVNMLISKCRTGCLTKTGGGDLTLSLEDSKLVGRYYENGSLVSTESFSVSGMIVRYTTDSADTGPYLLADGALTISFDRSTGGLQPIDSLNPQIDGSYCTSILFGTGRVYTIEVVPVTGMHRLV